MRIRGNVLVCLFLTISVLAVYWQVRKCGFVNFDDTIYVSENIHVQPGISLRGIKWAFGVTEHTYWHPVTWLSHMLDCQLYGLKPGMHHVTNLIFHMASSLLLFFVFRRMTGALWKSAFVAALFAIHPINVDSVAWVSERKNVLSTFFWMLTMLAYVNYSKRPGVLRYMPVILVFMLGLLAKPMLVTLPFVLLMLDCWPLRRIRLDQWWDERARGFCLFLEKVPLFVLSLFSIYLSSLSLEQQGQLLSTKSVPMKLRLANALVSYVGYIGKMICPRGLAVFYPYPGSVPMWEVIGSGLLLILTSVLVFRSFKDRPYLGIGWGWYVLTILPVIGLIQGGLWPAMADRWAYVPFIGLFIMIGWGVPDLVSRWRYREGGLATIGTALFFMLMAATWVQVGYWKNSITLFEHALDVTSNNTVAHYNLGVALAASGKTTEAIQQYNEALRIDPNYVAAHNNLGVALAEEGRIDEAIGHYTEALSLNSGYGGAHYNLGNALAKKGHTKEAIWHYKEALSLDPGLVKAHNNLGLVLAKQGNIDDAILQYSEALKIDPDFAEAHNNLGNAYAKEGKIKDAIEKYRAALRLNPGYVDALNNLGNTLAREGKLTEAIRQYKEALKIGPGIVGTHINMGNALMAKGEIDEAVGHYKTALRLSPGSEKAHNYLGAALVRKGDIEGGIAHFREALRIRPDYAEAVANLKNVLGAKAKIDWDIVSLKGALRDNPGDAGLHYRLGSLYQSSGRLDEAIDEYKMSLSIRPEFIQAINSLAMVYAIKGEYDSATSLFENLIRLRPDNVNAYYNMACLYARQNKVENSISWLKKAIRKGYENWDMIKSDKDLANIRGTTYYREIMKGH